VSAAAVSPAPVVRSEQRSDRLDSVDLLRGLVMVLMALDHARDFVSEVRFAPEDVTQTSIPLFLTRWVTHFCAPTFFLLAGMGAGITAARGRPRGELARFLATRGVWLVVMELTLVNFAWNFNTSYEFVPFAVIWALGWSMIALAGLVFLPMWATTLFAVVLIAGHNLLDGINPSGAGLPITSGRTLLGAPPSDWIWAILHVPVPPVIYPLIPWIGVMTAGFVLGPWLLQDAEVRRSRFLRLGLTLILLFLLLRGINAYGDPQPWSVQASPAYTVLSFLNTQKYPPSLLFLLMTLGPALALLPILERASGPIARFFITFGRVPFFFYLAHLYLVHALAVILGVAAGFPPTAMLTFFLELPDGYGYGLPVVYGAWIAVVLALYPLCRRFADLKARRHDWWLRYL